MTPEEEDKIMEGVSKFNPQEFLILWHRLTMIDINRGLDVEGMYLRPLSAIPYHHTWIAGWETMLYNKRREQ